MCMGTSECVGDASEQKEWNKCLLALRSQQLMEELPRALLAAVPGRVVERPRAGQPLRVTPGDSGVRGRSEGARNRARWPFGGRVFCLYKACESSRCEDSPKEVWLFL